MSRFLTGVVTGATLWNLVRHAREGGHPTPCPSGFPPRIGVRGDVPSRERRKWDWATLREIAGCLTLITAAWLLAACGPPAPWRQESYVFGTRVELLITGVPEAQARAAGNRVLQEFDRLHRSYCLLYTSDAADE